MVSFKNECSLYKHVAVIITIFTDGNTTNSGKKKKIIYKHTKFKKQHLEANSKYQ